MNNYEEPLICRPTKTAISVVDIHIREIARAMHWDAGRGVNRGVLNFGAHSPFVVRVLGPAAKFVGCYIYRRAGDG